MCVCVCVCPQHEPLQPECAEMVRERVRQAASDLSFMPQLQQACVTEVATLCTGPHLTGAKVIDCLADHRWEHMLTHTHTHTHTYTLMHRQFTL